MFIETIKFNEVFGSQGYIYIRIYIVYDKIIDVVGVALDSQASITVSKSTAENKIYCMNY